MFKRLCFLYRQVWYDLYTGFLLRPALITFSMVLLAIALITLEKELREFLPVKLGHWVFSGDVSSAQAVLGTIASSMITVVSIIYSVLVMSLTLASTQFSPRILHEFVRDRASQNQLGIFIGTFAYCHITLLSIQRGTQDFVPDLSITMGVVLALVSLGYLIYFIHHIAQFIQVNYLIDIIAKQTEDIIKEVYQREHHYCEGDGGDDTILEIPEDSFPLASKKSGYIQIIDEESLIEMAKDHELSFFVRKAVGDFIVEGSTIMIIHPAAKVTPALKSQCLPAFDIGPVRTMQQDIEFGIRQIADVALKAISPAVNDPTTASTCIDHLGRILTLIARQKTVPWTVYGQDRSRVLLNIRRTTMKSALELSFNQIRQYGNRDSAVLTALMRTLVEVAQASERKEYLELIRCQANLLDTIVEKSLGADDSKEFIAQSELLHRSVNGKNTH
jgi:uncharacterized membrane protein